MSRTLHPTVQPIAATLYQFPVRAGISKRIARRISQRGGPIFSGSYCTAKTIAPRLSVVTGSIPRVSGASRLPGPVAAVHEGETYG